MDKPEYMSCGNDACSSCNPPDDGIPRLHGWITLDYAKQMLNDLIKFILDAQEYEITSEGLKYLEELEKNASL